MRGNVIVMKVLALICCAVVAAVVTLASEPARKLVEARSSPNGWESDMGYLDLLAKTIQDEDGAAGIIFVYGGNDEVAQNDDRRIRCFEEYMTQRRGIPADRIRVMVGGYREHATIELWLVPSGAELPKKTPTLGREDVRPKKRGTKYRCDN
jgi:hypothetical protein